MFIRAALKRYFGNVAEHWTCNRGRGLDHVNQCIADFAFHGVWGSCQSRKQRNLGRVASPKCQPFLPTLVTPHVVDFSVIVGNFDLYFDGIVQVVTSGAASVKSQQPMADWEGLVQVAANRRGRPSSGRVVATGSAEHRF
jgi:hypothetical protein